MYSLGIDLGGTNIVASVVDDQYNIIEVDGTRIRDKEDNSPDQIAVQTGWISQPGQTSICLPHGLMIEIVSTEPATSDNDTIIPL